MLAFRKNRLPNILPEFTLDGFRIYMRTPKLEDYQSWFDVRSKNQIFLQPFEPTWPKNCLSEEFFEKRIQRQIRNWYSDRSYALLIFTKDNQLIGGMNINNICRGTAQFCTLGYWISQEFEGQGFMSEALRLTIKYCFEDLKLHRINASCLLHNDRSKNLLLRAGFEEEGLAKRYLKINGKWQDHYLFGLMIEDWEIAQKA